MYHGFTSCAQQFEDIGRRVAAEGYDVLIPRLPGHGLVPIDGLEGRTDDLSRLPTSAEDYDGFVREMDAISALSRGERIVVGLSMGGALTFGTLNLDIGRETQVWDRGLAMAIYV